MKIALLLPSRGIVRTQLIQALDRELKQIPHERFFTHDLPIPECFTNLTQRALKNPEFTHLWYVEEDIVPPPRSLKSLLDLDTAIAFVDYPIVKFPSPHCFKYFQGKLVWVGLGCTLVKREVLENMELPWFSGKHQLIAIHRGSAQKSWELQLREDPQRKYGGQDVYFCSKAVISGYNIGIVEGMQCGHDPVGSEGAAFYETHFEDKYAEQV